MKLSIVLLALALTGCFGLGLQDMSADQIRATNGITNCATLDYGTFGRGSSISMNTDDVRKGVTAKGAITITCGAASMTIKSDVGVAPVPPKPSP